MSYNKTAPRVITLSFQPTYVGSTNIPTALMASASLCYLFVNATVPSDFVVGQPLPSLRFNLFDPAISGLNITAAGKTVTYAQLAALLRQGVLDRAAAQGIL